MPPIPSAFVEMLARHCRFVDGEVALDPEQTLQSLGVTSLAIVHIVVDLEAGYGIQVPDEMMTTEVFATPRSLWEAVDSLQRRHG